MRETERGEKKIDKRESEREVVLEVVLCIIGLFIQVLLHKCARFSVLVGLCILLMCPLSCVHGAQTFACSAGQIRVRTISRAAVV